MHTGWNIGDPESARFNDPRHIAQVARGMPDLSIIISHYFWPRVDYCYDVTCDVPNISHDTSGLADEEVVRETGLDRIRDVLVRTIRDKPQQVLFGSDYGMCDPSKHVELIRSLPIPPEERDAVLSDNAIAMFQLDVARGGGVR